MKHNMTNIIIFKYIEFKCTVLYIISAFIVCTACSTNLINTTSIDINHQLKTCLLPPPGLKKFCILMLALSFLFTCFYCLAISMLSYVNFLQ